MKRCFRCVLGVVVCLLASNAEAVDFNLFGDTQFVSSGKNASFDLGAMDLSVEHNVSDTSVVTADFLFETSEHGYETEIERLKISRQLSTNFNLSMGRMVSGQGFWQQTFHHGSLSQDTVTPPIFLENLERHDGIITAHATGMALEGKWGSFSTVLTVSNPGGIDTNPDASSEGGLTLVDLDHGAVKRHFTQLLRLVYEPNWKSEIGLLVENKPVIELAQKDSVLDSGAAFACSAPPQDRSAVETGDLLFRVLRSGFDYYYNGDKFYTYLEYSRIGVKDGDFLLRCYDPSGVNNALLPKKDRYEAIAYYAQVGYRLNSELAFTVRHESLDIGNNATLYQLTGWQSLIRNVVAMNYRFDASNALRVEYNKSAYADPAENAQDGNSEVRIQWFFLVL